MAVPYNRIYCVNLPISIPCSFSASPSAAIASIAAAAAVFGIEILCCRARCCCRRRCCLLLQAGKRASEITEGINPHQRGRDSDLGGSLDRFWILCEYPCSFDVGDFGKPISFARITNTHAPRRLCFPAIEITICNNVFLCFCTLARSSSL